MECSWSRNITCSNLGIPLLLTLVVYSDIVEAANVIRIATPQNQEYSMTTVVGNIYHRSWMCKILNISTVAGIRNCLVGKIEAQQARCPMLCEVITTRPPSENICYSTIARSGYVGLSRDALRKRGSHKPNHLVPNSAASAVWSELVDRGWWFIQAAKIVGHAGWHTTKSVNCISFIIEPESCWIKRRYLWRSLCACEAQVRICPILRQIDCRCKIFYQRVLTLSPPRYYLWLWSNIPRSYCPYSPLPAISPPSMYIQSPVNTAYHNDQCLTAWRRLRSLTSMIPSCPERLDWHSPAQET